MKSVSYNFNQLLSLFSIMMETFDINPVWPEAFRDGVISLEWKCVNG